MQKNSVNEISLDEDFNDGSDSRSTSSESPDASF